MTDASLPTLDVALDAQRMAGILATACLPVSGRYEVRDCRIGHVRHKPGRTCLIGYELQLFDREQGAEVRQYLCGRVYPPALSVSRWRKAALQQLAPAVAAEPLTFLADQEMVVWAFPNERKLRGVERLLAPAAVRETLCRVLNRAVTDVAIELVRYIPEHGCTVRVTADSDVFFGKVYPDDQGARTWHAMRELWRHSRRHLVLAEPVAYCAETRTLWQRAVDGGGPLDLAACLRSIAELHELAVEGLPQAADPRAELQAAVDRLRDVSPRVADIAAEVERRLPATLHRATVHGDLHRKNFLQVGDRAALLDLDTLAQGNPRRDLGSFLASLPAGQLSLDGHGYACRDVATFTALALIVERASRAVSRRKANPEAALPAILDRAQTLLDETATARDVMRRFATWAAELPGEKLDVHYRTFRKVKSWHKSSATVSYRHDGLIHVRQLGGDESAWVFPQDPALPWLPEAMTPELVKAHVPLPAEDVRVEVLNYRPLNRCTARYCLNGKTRIYGKTYSDDRGALVNQRLAALYQLRGRDFPMPEPLGYSARIHTVWQREFAGDCLENHLERPTLLRAAGSRLAFLHGSGIACAARESREEQWGEAAKKIAKLVTVLPELAPRFDALLAKLEQRILSWSVPLASVVHGDFHVRQLMVRGDEVALFDFDELGCGDPAEDFGTFFADLAAKGFDARPYLHELLAGYAAAVAPEGIAWHTALQLLTRAYRGLLQLRPDLDARAERLLALAEGVLA